jgi:hypothetical protein
MKDVTFTVNATDGCGGTPTWAITGVSSNEPVNGTGDGNTSPDWLPVDNHTVQLRAEREGTGSGRIYTITISVTDCSGNTSTTTASVVVAHNIDGPVNGNAFKVGSTVNLSGTFWDVPGKKHTAKWSIDGTLITGTVAEPSGLKNGTVTGSYKFTSPGIYKLQMNVTDQNGLTSYVNTNGDLEAIVVIYDPNGGFTYGSGCFVSPAGAIPSNPTATGPVSFGFQSNYYKGATYPKGETQFDFQTTDFEFNALNFDYLVVNGAFAQFKGSGKIIGDQSGYAFIMTVIDGDAPGGGGVDKIRMKIYNKNTGEVKYDNMPGAGDADIPIATVCPGSTIRITDPVPTTMTVATRQAEVVQLQAFKVKASPNPTEHVFTLNVESDNLVDKVEIKVHDISGRQVYTTTGGINRNYQFGEKFTTGIYFVEVKQGDKRSIIKLIKQ